MKTKSTLILFAICFFAHTAQAQMSVSVTVTPNNPCDTCANLTANVSGGTMPYTHQWYLNGAPFATGQNAAYCKKQPWNVSGDSIMLVVTDASSQQASWLATGADLISSGIPSGYQLCIVTTDTGTGKNLLVWNQSTNSSVVSYNVYKQNASSSWIVIANVPRNSFSTFVDTASNPAQQSYWYHISVLDSCGFESSLTTTGIPVNTIHLVISAGIPPAWNLSWNATQGYPVTKYRIWRGTATSSPTLIDSVSGSVYAYTDPTPPANVSKYIVEALSSAGCIPSFKNQNTLSAYNSSFSNIANPDINSVNEINDVVSISIAPNPFSVQTVLQTNIPLKNATYTVVNHLGQTVARIKDVNGQAVTLSRENLPGGFYFLRLIQDGKMILAGKTVIIN